MSVTYQEYIQYPIDYTYNTINFQNIYIFLLFSFVQQ